MPRKFLAFKKNKSSLFCAYLKFSEAAVCGKSSDIKKILILKILNSKNSKILISDSEIFHNLSSLFLNVNGETAKFSYHENVCFKIK